MQEISNYYCSITWSYKSSMKIENYINEKDDIHNGVNNEETHILWCLVLKGNVVGHLENNEQEK